MRLRERYTPPMRAIVVTQFGGPEELRLADIPDPQPAPGQVVVRLHAAGVNPYEAYIRSGKYARLPELPYTPGSDGAGVVESVGDGRDDGRAGSARLRGDHDRARWHLRRAHRLRLGDGAPAPRCRLVQSGRLSWRTRGHRLSRAHHSRTRASLLRPCWCTAPAAAWASRPCSSPEATAFASSAPPGALKGSTRFDGPAPIRF